MARRSQPKRHSPRPTPAERKRRTRKVQAEVQQGTYDDAEKLRLALDRMIDRLLERSKR